MELNKHDPAYQRAKKQVQEIRFFYLHLTAYCIIIPMLIAINLIFVPHYIWFFFPILGWGCGLTIHAMEVFGFNPFYGKKWEERKMREFIEKEKQQNQKNTDHGKL